MNLQDLIKLTNSEEIGKLIYKMYLLSVKTELSIIDFNMYDKLFLKEYLESRQEIIENKLKEL